MGQTNLIHKLGFLKKKKCEHMSFKINTAPNNIQIKIKI